MRLHERIHAMRHRRRRLPLRDRLRRRRRLVEIGLTAKGMIVKQKFKGNQRRSRTDGRYRGSR